MFESMFSNERPDRRNKLGMTSYIGQSVSLAIDYQNLHVWYQGLKPKLP